MRPGYITYFDARGSGLRHFPADTHLIDWLMVKGIAFDVVTDHDLDREGVALINPYRAVVTGSHPEYHTPNTLNAFQPEFSGAFERAREMRVNVWSERMMDEAQDGSRDRDAKGGFDKQHILRSKLTVEAIQWQMARLDPKRWAEKRLLNANVTTSVADMNEHQREAAVQQLLKRLEVIARPVIEERKRLQAQQEKLVDMTPPEPTPMAVSKKSAIGR